MYGAVLSDEALLAIANDCETQIGRGVHCADYMTKNRTELYWGDTGFLEAYRSTLRALEFLKAEEKNKQVELNGKTIIRTEYHIRTTKS